MAIIKCKICGGDIALTADKTFGVCEFCGSTMTLPRIDDEQRAAAFNRGNHFRRIGEFDKALAVYERIVQEDDTDAEAHWCCALCRFGIEYVEDPETLEYLPTCHRASFDSFLEDVDYQAALQYSDGITNRQYQKDAAKIAEVQRGILAASQNTKPFDVFICYKESDENGERTRDSMLAQDIYYQLTDQGRRVFFSRITLEEVAGTQYEPYIFAALNSAKVMVVVGTKPEHLNAVWVRNEWSRFLSMMKKDRNKLLLPCYRDMDPYEMPEQLAVLQSYDMAKIGFIQDLTRGIAKVLDADKKPESVKPAAVQSAATPASPLLQRAFLFLEDGDWDNANTYCERVLDMEPQNAMAYVGKLMVELGVRKMEDLREQEDSFANRNNYQKALRFADEELKATLTGYIAYIINRKESERVESLYKRAKMAMGVTTEFMYREAAKLFEELGGYKDSASCARECIEKAEVIRKDGILESAKSKMIGSLASNYEDAITQFETIPGWKDADEQIGICREKIKMIHQRNAQNRKLAEKERADREERNRRQAEEDRRTREKLEREKREAKQKRKKRSCVIWGIICTAVAFIILLNKVIIPGQKYSNALEMLETGNYEEAIAVFESLDGYKDSAEIAERICREQKTNQLKSAQVGDYVYFGAYEQDNNISNGREEIEWLVLKANEEELLLISKYALDCQPYNVDYKEATWETSSIRRWLNSRFLDYAFTADERVMLSSAMVSADNNPYYKDTLPGDSVRDRVFLLSVMEAERYFESDVDRQCVATEYAVANGVHIDTITGNCWWWLRSPGVDQSRATGVYYDGDVYGYGNAVYSSNFAVRPVLWIDISSLP